MAKKYQYYQIEVLHSNGNKEDIEMLKSSDLDKSNYKQMLKVYKEIKAQYEEQDVIIKFCGSSSDGVLDVIFTKGIRLDNETAENDIVIDDRFETVKLVEDLYIIGEKLQERYDYLTNRLGVFDKITNNILHNMEFSDSFGKTDDDKIRIYNELKDNQIKRRDIKNEMSMSHSLITTDIIKNIKEIAESATQKISKIEKTTKKIEDKIQNGIHNGTTPESWNVYEFKYKNFQDRMRLMKEKQKEYDRVFHDEEKQVVACCKKCRK